MDYKDYIEKMIQRIKQEMSVVPEKYNESQISFEELMVPASDGARMKTFIIRPTVPECMPVLFQRSCYPHNFTEAKTSGYELAKRGFGYVMQFCRGTGGSEGQWEPNVNERQDGIDSIHWLASLDWVESIGFYGASYLALTGWAMIDKVPEKVKGMYLSVYGTNRHVSAYKDGLFRQDILTAWAMGNAGSEISADFMESCKYLPQIHVDENLWGLDLPWYRDLISHTDYSDAYWQEGFWSVLRSNPSKVKIPVVIEEGWYDHHLGSALSGYREMADLDNCMLKIGPWNHGKMPAIHGQECHNPQSQVLLPIYQWFDGLLNKGEQPKGGVSLYVIGQDSWIEEDRWPQKTREMRLYLDTGSKTLSTQTPNDTQNISFIYDPKNPQPSFGAESCFRSMASIGSLKQPEPDYRSDVISFISQPFKEDTLIIGEINADVFVSSDAEDTAFSIKAMEVFENGDAYNIRSGITTLAYRSHSDERQTYTPGDIVKVNINTWDIAWEVKAGSSIRVDISSSDFPQYCAHTNYSGVWSLQEKCKKAKQTIYSGKDFPSVLNIPVFKK